MALGIMSSLLKNPQHWRARALEARALAEKENDPECRKRLLSLAEEYDSIAEKADLRARVNLSTRRGGDDHMVRPGFPPMASSEKT